MDSLNSLVLHNEDGAILQIRHDRFATNIKLSWQQLKSAAAQITHAYKVTALFLCIG